MLRSIILFDAEELVAPKYPTELNVWVQSLQSTPAYSGAAGVCIWLVCYICIYIYVPNVNGNMSAAQVEWKAKYMYL